MHVNKEEMAPASQVTSVETLNELAVVIPRIKDNGTTGNE